MGVTGLWTVLQPCARPIKLETLNKKRLAVDASIWIYQFLKAVRDKEGNALRNSHVVGFFRRICKLLYFGIKPVFVFDGGAPILKRQTIAARKKRREGRREDATRTAGKLLAVQMQRTAEEEAESRRQKRNRPSGEEQPIPDVPVYADETFMTEQEKQKARKFKKKDQYHLPNLDVSLEEMGAPNDPRIMSQEELEEYARQFHRGQDINLYDFSKIDFDGPFFLSLPATDRYNILNAARLRSRLRMGYSKEQLDTMFPDRMAFSRFQIERVAERNDLTQRLMNINGMNGEDAFYKSGQRIAGERGREYVLVKDSQNEGGWVLGVVGNKEAGREDKPIDVDQYGQAEHISDSDEVSDDDEFEDVPIEGINRLPKLPFLREGAFDESLQQAREDLDMQKVLFESRQSVQRASSLDFDDDALFVKKDQNALPLPRRGDSDVFEEDHDDELERAIALSLQPAEDADEDMPDLSINRDTRSTIRAGIAPDHASDTSEDDMDFSAAVAQTKITQKKPLIDNPFSGPLPFESISLKKPDPIKSKSKEDEKLDDDAGGFLKEPEDAKKKTEPLPPWFFTGKVSEGFIAEPSFEEDKDQHEIDNLVVFPKKQSPEIIDVDDTLGAAEVIDLEADEDTDLNTSADPDKANLMNAAPGPRQEAHVQDNLASDVADDVAHGHPQADRPKEEEPAIIFEGEKLRTPSPEVEMSPEPEFEDVVPPSPPPIHISAQSSGPASMPVTGAELSSEAKFELASEHPGPVPFDQGDDDFSDPEDEDLMRQLAAEGEEHVRFAQTLNSDIMLNEVDYEKELKQLRNQQRKDRRDADEVTQIMINECQQLLRLFGLPYVTAPMEAEAQCAELVTLGLVDGIVTDDSDTFLFGGTRVYKNMFNQSKFVECYLASDLEKEFALHRGKLISFAHLLGSDYTEGIPGIGPVKALEIITEFPNLAEFREWWTELQMGVNQADDTHAAFRKKFRKQASKIFLPPTFPDTRVDEAYLHPEVDSDPSPFQWGVPDLNGLRQFLMATIGWSQERTDEVLVPVIRDMNRRAQEGTQSNITQFMQGSLGAGAFAPRVRPGGPSRMEKAFGRLRQEARGDPIAPSAEPASAPVTSPLDGSDSDEDDTREESSSGKRAATKNAGTRGISKKRKTRGA